MARWGYARLPDAHPDGTTFAKVAWSQHPDGKGFVRTGEFQQVEFMIKDSKEYASTAGWGWARWRGAGLRPYGTTPTFSDECIGCHMPMRSNDYVFTMPINGQ
jgi:cytochrome P460